MIWHLSMPSNSLGTHARRLQDVYSPVARGGTWLGGDEN
jgi:hypothetical protein